MSSHREAGFESTTVAFEIQELVLRLAGCHVDVVGGVCLVGWLPFPACGLTVCRIDLLHVDFDVQVWCEWGLERDLTPGVSFIDFVDLCHLLWRVLH